MQYQGYIGFLQWNKAKNGCLWWCLRETKSWDRKDVRRLEQHEKSKKDDREIRDEENEKKTAEFEPTTHWLKAMLFTVVLDTTLVRSDTYFFDSCRQKCCCFLTWAFQHLCFWIAMILNLYQLKKRPMNGSRHSPKAERNQKARN